jgi:predicted small metal-binding protein
MSEAKRKVVDCRLQPSEKGCTLSIEGTEDEVLEAATDHAITVHGHTNSPELREQIRSIMKDVEQ